MQITRGNPDTCLLQLSERFCIATSIFATLRLPKPGLTSKQREPLQKIAINNGSKETIHI
jgi:hypothetical protein